MTSHFHLLYNFDRNYFKALFAIFIEGEGDTKKLMKELYKARLDVERVIPNCILNQANDRLSLLSQAVTHAYSALDGDIDSLKKNHKKYIAVRKQIIERFYGDRASDFMNTINIEFPLARSVTSTIKNQGNIQNEVPG